MATITKSIGTSSRDYSTVTLWEADLDNTTPYDAADDAVGEMYDDAAFDETFTINGGGTIGLNSVKLSVASTERHDGTAGTGARIVRTAVGTVITTVPLSGSNKLTLEWFEINCNGQAITTTINANSGTAGRVPIFRNLISHDAVNSAASFRFISAGTRDVLLTNCMVYDYVATANNRPITIFELDADQANGGCLNNTIYKFQAHGTGIAIGIYVGTDSANGRVRNNISVGGVTNPSSFVFIGAVNLTSSNNLSDDATADDGGGSNHVINATLANIFVSTTNGSEDLSLKAGSPAIDVGVDLVTTPTGVNIDIKGRDRDAQGDTWDIGAHEYVATVTNRDGLLLMGVGA